MLKYNYFFHIARAIKSFSYSSRTLKVAKFNHELLKLIKVISANLQLDK